MKQLIHIKMSSVSFPAGPLIDTDLGWGKHSRSGTGGWKEGTSEEQPPPD